MLSDRDRHLLNRMNSTAAAVQLGKALADQKGCLRATYDFSTQGGAVSTINLKGSDGLDAKLPSGAVISEVLIDVVTAATSGGAATVALTAQVAEDLLAALAVASVTGLIAGIPVGTAATSIKLTAERTITTTIAVAALTAGKFHVFIEYYLLGSQER
jgi:hypothetical protein